MVLTRCCVRAGASVAGISSRLFGIKINPLSRASTRAHWQHCRRYHKSEFETIDCPSRGASRDFFSIEYLAATRAGDRIVAVGEHGAIAQSGDDEKT